MLNEEQKKFILENYKQHSSRHMARHLRVSRRDVSDFIGGIKKTPATFQAPSALTPFLVPVLVCLLLAVHLTLRFDTFWLSHYPGDQNQYVGLAMKLQEQGMKGYNLRAIDARPADEQRELASLMLSQDEEGALMRGLKQSGAGYYDIPFFHKGPAFSIAIMLSHQVFARGKDYLMVIRHLGEDVRHAKPAKFFKAQFYAVIVPLFFSTGLMLLTFYLGKILFSPRVGFYAAFMMAVNPIAILTSCKLWADDMLAFFVALSVVLFFLGQDRDKLWLSFLGGVSCGIAVLAKQNGGIIFCGLIAYSVLIKRSFKHLIPFGIGLTVASAPWFYKIYSIYGDPLYRPVSADVKNTDTTGWFAMIASRPDPLILFAVGIPYLSPPFVLAYGTLKNFLLRLRLWNPRAGLNEEGGHITLLWFWILSFILFFIFLMGGDEHRRMLPAYPAIAILAGYVLDRLRIKLGALFENKIFCESAVIVMLVICAFWSVPMGVSTVMENGALILKPF